MRVSLQSSLLAWASYDPPAGGLEIAFRSGERYLYFRLPPSCYQPLLHADSKGQYFNRYIRNCFHCQHLSRPSPPHVQGGSPRSSLTALQGGAGQGNGWQRLGERRAWLMIAGGLMI